MLIRILIKIIIKQNKSDYRYINVLFSLMLRTKKRKNVVETENYVVWVRLLSNK